jgi:hypothetical protein
MASEYKVIILDPAPTEAAETLNALAAQGWTVAGVYADDRVILFRFTETFTMASGGFPQNVKSSVDWFPPIPGKEGG